MRKFKTIDRVSVEEAAGQSGWELGPGGDSLMDAHGNEAFFIEEDGYLIFSFGEDCEYRDLLERVPCDEEE
jgi:hypothetical protein